jgi:hypothetical protein
MARPGENPGRAVLHRWPWPDNLQEGLNDHDSREEDGSMCEHCAATATHQVTVGRHVLRLCPDHAYVAMRQSVETGTVIEVRPVW